MLSAVGRDRERLLHEAIRLVPIPVWTVLRVAVIALHAVPIRILVEVVAPTLAFHLAVGQEAAGYAAGAP